MTTMTARLSIVLAMVALLVVACGDSDSPAAPTALSEAVAPDALFAPMMPVANVPSMPGTDAMTGGTVIVLDAPGESKQYGLGIDLKVGERRQLRTQHGGVDRTANTTWTTNRPDVADFPDKPGLIRARKTGTAWIKAQWGRYFRTMRVEVGAGDLPTGTVWSGTMTVGEPRDVMWCDEESKEVSKRYGYDGYWADRGDDSTTLEPTTFQYGAVEFRVYSVQMDRYENCAEEKLLFSLQTTSTLMADTAYPMTLVIHGHRFRLPDAQFDRYYLRSGNNYHHHRWDFPRGTMVWNTGDVIRLSLESTP